MVHVAYVDGCKFVCRFSYQKPRVPGSKFKQPRTFSFKSLIRDLLRSSFFLLGVDSLFMPQNEGVCCYTDPTLDCNIDSVIIFKESASSVVVSFSVEFGLISGDESTALEIIEVS